MKKTKMRIHGCEYPLYRMNTLVIGTGAASLNCAEKLYRRGMSDMLIVTEKVGGGTSNNTGSDKQTYYKTSVFGEEADTPFEMVKSLFNGGAMHGDIALTEATLSAQGFFNLANIGVQFPHNRYGGFVGYKTDHDPKQRATSAGPWTSSQMFTCLLREVRSHGIEIMDNTDIVSLVVEKKGSRKKVVGAVGINKKQTGNKKTRGLVLFQAENVVFGVGGPGGIYKTSVYPKVHKGAIGLALEAGAKAQNLTESQYGLASIKFRWNVSGTYQQVIPRYISTATDGSDEKEFLNEYFPDMGTLVTDIFLKGYQWPFDSRKIENYGSSLIDVLVYIETVIRGRRVFMDFRDNPRGGSGLKPFNFKMLDPEAYEYLENSKALFGTPIQRLKHMNSMAIDLYKKHGIDLNKEPLEIAVCAQHNNGGLTGDIWWESENIKNLFPVGEVNGSHGVYRPGGSALNSGQVGSLRAAQRISEKYSGNIGTISSFKKSVSDVIKRDVKFIENNLDKKTNRQNSLRKDFQERMTRFGAHIRDEKNIETAVSSARKCLKDAESGVGVSSPGQLPEAFRNRHLALTHLIYLEAIKEYLSRKGGSRGSYMVMDPRGKKVLDKLGNEWKFRENNPALDSLVQETSYSGNGRVRHKWVSVRPVPGDDSWFENVWNDFLKKKVFD
ncbi:MAG: FAD-binding protein [Fibrobacterota bacterium]